MRARCSSLALFLVTTIVVAAPVPKYRQKTVELEETYWESDAETGVGKMYIWLGHDGRMNHRYGNTTYTNSSWKRNGVEFYFQLNNSYYWYRGTVEGDRITGGAQNVANGNWTYNFKRLDKAPEDFVVKRDAPIPPVDAPR